MIQQCNFGATVKIFLQSGITLFIHDLECHLLKPFLYFNDMKRWHYIQYTQIRKEHSIQSVFYFWQDRSSQKFFRYEMFKLLLLSYLLQKKVWISTNTSNLFWILPTLIFLDKIEWKWQQYYIDKSRFQGSKILV